MSDVLDPRFLKAFDVLLEFEGFRSNDPVDPGGDTVFGVSIANHPQTHQWICAALPDLDRARQRAALFYQQQFWSVQFCGHIGNQRIATEVFECSVNVGLKQAALIVQRACNEYAGRAELVEDGFIGPKTIAKLNACSDANPLFMLALLNKQQAYHYAKLVATRPVMARFLNGWLKRTQILA
jgi:lysozyme family protein